MSEFPVSLTPEAVDQAKRLIARKLPGGVLRIGVKGGGCSGLEYLMHPDTPTDADLTAEFDGLTVAIDPRASRFLVGTTVKYTGNLMGGGFTFDNPNAARSCGCGTSFTLKT